MISNLGTRNANLRATVEARITALEYAMGRVSSRTLNGSPGYASLRRVSKTSHGWSVGTWVKLIGPGANWSTAVTGATLTADAIGVVLNVIDVNTVEVVIDGLVQMVGSSYTGHAIYYLSTTPGVATSTRPSAPNVVQPLFVSFTGGWIALFGQAAVVPRSRRLSELLDVDSATVGAPANRDLLTYDTASATWKAVAGGVTSLGARTALSVLGNPTNASTTASDIVAAGDGQVLHRNGPILEFGLVGTTGLAGSAVTAAKIGVDVVLDTLNDVTIASVANKDFLRYDSGTSQWKNVNLGDLSWTSATRTLALDGGLGTASPSLALVGAAGSRLIVGGGCSFDFILSGTTAAGDDISARIREVSASQVSFYDQGTSTYSTGTEVLRWNCSSSAGSRSFDFMVPVNLSTALTVANGGTAATTALDAAVNLLLVRFAFDRAGTRLTTTTSSTHTFNGSSKIFMAVMTGGGGGGNTSTGTGSGQCGGNGGGGGELVIIIGKITAATATYICGAAGANGSTGSDGSPTTFTMSAASVTAAGGQHGPTPSAISGTGRGGAGGVSDWSTGAQSSSFMVLRFPGNLGQPGHLNSITHAAGVVSSIQQAGGQGGASLLNSNGATPYGQGGVGGSDGSAGSAGTQGCIMIYEA